jgi:two-component system, OmpR family, sensor histidine kinase YxdK
MRLFIREHLPLIVVQVLQLAVIVLIFWLDGYRNLPTALYGVFLGLVGLSAYLVWRYVTHREFYRKLSEPAADLEDTIRQSGHIPLGEALDGLMKDQYRHYQDGTRAIEQRMTEHLTFINQWVHQMKTPLSIIHLIVQERDEPAYASIREEADRLEKGLETVLYAARLEAFQRDFRVEPVSLLHMVETAVHENKRLFIRNHIYPEVLVEGELKVESDAKWLIFAINQLLTNAIKYSGRNQKVTLSARQSGQQVMLEVRDHGVGIPKQDLKRVTEPFYTGENGRTHRESTGMGLYLVQEFCRHLGHTLELDSQVGEGTTARLIFAEGLTNLTEL